MTEDVFKQKLQHISQLTVSERWDLLREADPMYLTREVFDVLVNQLEDQDDHVRFFALHQLIDRFPKQLTTPSDALVDRMIGLLKDESHPVVDRVPWALSIMGEKGFMRLLERSDTNEVRLKRMIVWAIGKNANLHLAPERSINFLLECLGHADEETRYLAMSALVEISPLKNYSPYGLKSYDFTPVYHQLKPVAEYFVSKDDHNTEFAERYLRLINMALKNA